MMFIIKSNRRIFFTLSIVVALLLLLSNPIQAAILWSSLGSGINYPVRALAVDGGGNLYAGGNFTTAGGVSANSIAKWDGSDWSALGSGVNSTVFALAMDGSGNLYAGGIFSTAVGVSVNGIAKWDGSAWSALGSGMDDEVRALAVDGGGNLYAGGNFTTAGGVSANGIAKWDGSAWSALGSGMDDEVLALAVDGSGNLYAGGNFTTAGGVSAKRIAKWDGSAWSPLGSGNDYRVYVLAMDGSGNLYAGGVFFTAGGVSAKHIAKWDGSAWSALGSGMNDEVRALAEDGGGNLYVGGYFTTAGGVSANRVAKLSEDNTPPSITASTPANGATITPTNSILATFSEDMTHDGSASAANFSGNYVLVEAKGNGFQTTACNSTDFVNDTKINIDSAVYENHSGLGPYEATLTVNHGVPLEGGDYKLFICGTTSVTDLAGNKINGGADAITSFFVSSPAALPKSGGLPQTGFSQGVVTYLPSQTMDKAYQALDSISLEIPFLKISAPIVGVPSTGDGWDLTWLSDQVGWLEGTAFPTWEGNSALTAHVVDANGQPGLFHNLGDLSYGKEIIINAWGQRYVYQVRSVKTMVKPSDMSAFKHQDYPYLTLITCKGYDEKNDTYRWRVVVQAVQVRVE